MTHHTETQHTTQPASHPSALTRSSTLRVDTPCTDVTTANRARSIRRRRSSSEGKNDPVRIFGISRSRSPAWVVSSLSRWPLRQAVRWSVCSPGAAPITSVASASMSSCRMRSRTTLIASTPSARRVTPAAASAQTGTRPSRAPPVELPVHQGHLRDGLPLFREHAPPADARPGQTPARSGTLPGYTTSWDAIRHTARSRSRRSYPKRTPPSTSGLFASSFLYWSSAKRGPSSTHPPADDAQRADRLVSPGREQTPDQSPPSQFPSHSPPFADVQTGPETRSCPWVSRP